MKKRFIFSLLAISLAGLGLGGVSLAGIVDCETGEPATQNENAVVKISQICYDSVDGAISAATEGQTVEILKAGEYPLPDVSTAITIKGAVKGVVFTHSVSSSSNGKIAEVKGGTNFENVSFVLKGVKGQDYKHYIGSDGKISLKDCIIDGTLYVDSEMEFEDCNFVKNSASGENSNAYNVQVYNTAAFTNVIFTNEYGRNVNLWDKGDNTVRHTVSFNGVNFNNTSSTDSSKLPVMIHEARDYPKVSQWDVSFSDCTVNGSYNTTQFISDGILFGIDDILTNDGKQEDPARNAVSYGTLDGGDVVVKIDGITAYSTPSYAVAQIGETKYATLPEAINSAVDNNEILIIKSGSYVLPENIANVVTIKGDEDVVAKINHSVTNADNGKISTVVGGTVFENLVFVLTGVAGQDYHHYLASDGKITLKDCTIDGTMYVDSEMEFYNCEFIKEETKGHSNAFNVHVYNNAKFDNCNFVNDNSRNVNLWDKGTVALHTVIFDNVRFSNDASDAKKLPVMIHEARNYPNVSRWNVEFNNSDVLNNSKYNTDNFPGDGKFFGIDDILTSGGKQEDPSRTAVSSGTENGGDIVVKVDGATKYTTPKAGQSQRTVTFDGTNTGVVNNGDKVEKPADPAAQSCKSFVEWQLNGVAYDFNSVVTGNLTLTSKWRSTCGGGGSSSSSSSSNKTGNNTGATAESGTTADTGANTPTVDPQAVAANGYTNEMNEAYEFAYANGITTMKSIDEAEMLDGLTRIAMAKMLSQYAINVLGKSPADVEVPNFTDVSVDLDAEYANGVSLAYKLGIMGINMPDNKFLPYETVTRAQFGTALSRLLFGIEDGEDAYYTTHLAKLKEAGIITNDDPTLEELRGYVMLMLMRSAK